jgi:hypothetical protein
MFNTKLKIDQIVTMIENPLTINEMHKMIIDIKSIKNNKEKISYLKDYYYLFCPSSYTNNNHVFMHAMYNAMEVMHEKPTVSKDALLEMLEKRNINNNFNINDIKEIFNDF